MSQHPSSPCLQVSAPVHSHRRLRTRGGMVVAEHPLAARAGAEALARGGNAVDAAVTAAFMCGVVLPLENGLGGGGVMLVRQADGAFTTIDYAMVTGQHASPAMFDYESHLEPPGPDRHRMSRRFSAPAVRDSANVEGHRAVSVPGTAAGLADALRRLGSFELADAIAPALQVAEQGFTVGPALTLSVLRSAALLGRHPAAAELFLPDGLPPRPGSRLVQAGQAEVLRSIARDGIDVFYRGWVAERIVADLDAHGGILTAGDFAGYRTRIEDRALHGTHAGAGLHGATGANGCSLVIEALQVLGHLHPGRHEHGSAAHLHRLIEALKCASVDRYSYLGDPDLTGSPVDALVSAAFAAGRAAQVDPDRAGTPAAGDVWRHTPAPRPAAFPPPAGVPYGAGTTHVSAVDAAGNAVALTQTNVGFSGVVTPGVGIMLNNAMRWPEMQPGTVNSIYPGARCVHNMSPMILTRGDALHAVLGGSGGRRIPTAVVQAISNVLDFHMPWQAAVEAPRVHVESDEVLLDARLDGAAGDELRRLGHVLHLAGTDAVSAPFAMVCAIGADTDGLTSAVYPCGKPAAAAACD